MFYFLIENNNVIGTSECPCIAEGIECIEVTKEQYDQVAKNGNNYFIYQDGQVIVNPNYETELAEERKAEFNKDFFNTSLGYIRRKVSMANGETKDFLSDLLPTISMGVNAGMPVTVIAYNEPDYNKDVEDWTQYQHTETVTSQFIQECFLQLSNDFGA